ncbi:MAG: FeS cluster assembly protein SufD [Candidatus Omnitrophica bacterium ADurb.Bin277]|nr:MAG: FeS cluster assembly protein SufD [Candidatus Omnitrophica bacterium ADurb.Bin277]
MPDMTELQPYADVYGKLAPLRRREADWLRVMRDDAMRSFLDQGFPTVQDEAWRYTDLRALSGTRFVTDPAASRTAFENEKSLRPELDVDTLFFVNGWFRPQISDQPAGVRVTSLPEAGHSPEFLETMRHFHHFPMDSLQELNVALGMGGVFIEVPDHTKLKRPLYIIHWSDSHGGLCQPKTVLRMGRGARATIIEDFRGAEGKMYFTNSMTETFLDRGAALEHCKLQSEDRAAFHAAVFRAIQTEESALSSISLAFGSRLARHTGDVLFSGPGAKCSLTALSVGEGDQVLDHVTGVDHASPACGSEQLFKNILGGSSRGIYTGRVLVRRDAQKSDAHQTNRNLLLSGMAKADSRPQLEILADDVKCSHGAVIGQLDEDSVFYLRSRGIDEKVARGILATAFAAEILEGIKHDGLKEKVLHRMREKLKRLGEET